MKWLVVISLLVLAGVVVAKFSIPDKRDRLHAAGYLTGLDKEMTAAFTDAGEFSPIPKPGASDWLVAHPEKGQTYQQYLGSNPNQVSRSRRVLYIQPLGGFDKKKAPAIEVLREFTEAYFYPMKVVVRPTLHPRKITSRMNGGRQQWLTTDLLNDLQRKLPNDAYSMLGVTMTDLYPDPSWNFVFGQARIRARVGVFSFARYRPSTEGLDEKELQAANSLMLRRALKVLTHESGHMFGVRHCVYYHCNMNGANHMQEADATPMHLCPVCLRKLQHTIKFSPRARYQKLFKFYKKHDLKDEAEWVENRLKRMGE